MDYSDILPLDPAKPIALANIFGARWHGFPVPKTFTLAEQIAMRIGERIFSSQYLPGVRVVEQDVMNEFSVSHGPVRDGFRILEKDGLLKLNHNRGAQVSRLSVEEVTDIFEVRAALYQVVGQKTIEARHQEVLRILEQGVKRLESFSQSEDGGEQYAKTVFVVSLLTARCSGNTRLADIVTSLALQTLRYSMLGLKSVERRQESIRLWRAAYEANLRGDVEESKRLSLVRIMKSRDEALRLIALEEAADGRAAE